MPKNGNNRPLSLPVGKLSPPSFSAAPSFLDYVIGGAATDAEAVEGGLVSGEAPPEVRTWLVPDPRSQHQDPSSCEGPAQFCRLCRAAGLISSSFPPCSRDEWSRLGGGAAGSFPAGELVALVS